MRKVDILVAIAVGFVAFVVAPDARAQVTTITCSTSGGTCLSVAASGAGEDGLEVNATSSIGAGIIGYADGGIAVFGSSTSNYGVYGISSTNSGIVANSESGDALYAVSESGYGVYASSSSSNAIVGEVDSGDGQSGVAGISTAAGNGVYGRISGSSGTAYAIWGRDEATGGTHYAGYFTGNVYATGNITCGGTCNSDIRLKKNIEPLSGAVDRLLALRGVTFEWIDPAKHDNHTGEQVGVIAQEVEKVFPQWVQETPDTHVKNVDPDQRTVLALEVESIRALKSENDELRMQIRADRATVAGLKDELDALKAGRNPMTGDRGMLWLIGMVFAVGGGIAVSRKQAHR